MNDGGGTILVLTHGEDERPELLQHAAVRRGYAVASVRVDAVADRLPDPCAYDAVLVMGANESVYDDRVRWIAPELQLVKDAVAAEVPVLGVCFGGQILSHALGGQVAPAEREELGWLRLATDDGRLIPPGPWLAWHGDVFTVPPGARRLAWSDLCPHAFSSGPHLGVQFHPEVTPALLESWFDDAERRGKGVGAQREALLREAEQHAPGALDRADALLAEFLRRARLLGAATADTSDGRR